MAASSPSEPERIDSLRKLFDGDPSLQVKFTKERGRYFVAAKDFLENDTVLAENGYAISVYYPAATNTCDVCYAYNANAPLPVSCAECRKVYFCSQACCDAGMTYHKPLECQLLKAFDNAHVPDENMICGAMLTIRVFALRRIEASLQNALPYSYYTELIAHHQKEYPRKMAKLYDVTIDYLLLLDRNVGLFAGVSRDEILLSLLRYHSNSFGLWSEPEWTEASKCIGTGIYLKACFFNHSCSPNIKAVRKDCVLTFVATEAIKQGSDMCISYVDPGLPYGERRAELRNEFLFTCFCQTCVTEKAQRDIEKRQKRKRKPRR